MIPLHIRFKENDLIQHENGVKSIKKSISDIVRDEKYFVFVGEVNGCKICVTIEGHDYSPKDFEPSQMLAFLQDTHEKYKSAHHLKDQINILITSFEWREFIRKFSKNGDEK